MSFALKFTEKGRSTLKRLHIGVQSRIKHDLKVLVSDPRIGKKLSGDLEGFWSWKIGRYRAIYTIEWDCVLVHRVGHRKTVYELSLDKQ